jgi:hypothetical protein
MTSLRTEPTCNGRPAEYMPPHLRGDAAECAPGGPAVREPGRPWPLDELAAWLSCSPKTISRLLHAGRLQRVPGFGRRVLVTDASVRKLAEGG